MSSLFLTTHHASCWKYLFKPRFNGEKLEISLGCHEVYPWRVSTTSFVEWGGLTGAKMVPALIRDRLSLTSEGKLQWKVCLHPHLEQGGTPLVGKSYSFKCHFSPLLQMGASSSRINPFRVYLIKNCDNFDPQRWKKTHLIFFCDTEWPQYPLEDGEMLTCWNIPIITVLQLDWFCRK